MVRTDERPRFFGSRGPITGFIAPTRSVGEPGRKSISLPTGVEERNPEISGVLFHPTYYKDRRGPPF